MRRERRPDKLSFDGKKREMSRLAKARVSYIRFIYSPRCDGA
jgi:hypothetical protein